MNRGGVRQLRRRLTAVCALSTGLVLLGMALFSMSFSTKRMEEQYRQRFQSEVNNVFFYLRGQTALDHSWLARMEESGGLLILIRHPGQTLFWNSRTPEKTPLAHLAAQMALDQEGLDYTLPPRSRLEPDVVVFPFAAGGARYHGAVATVPTQEKGWVGVVVLKNTAGEEAELRHTQQVYAASVLLALLCLGGAAWFFSAWAVRPVEEGRRRQLEFVAAASHELRSPLAVMRATVGALGHAPPDQAARFAETIDLECSRLARLSEDLLALAGADGGTLPLTMAPVDPQTLLLSAGERFEELAREKGVRLELSLPQEDLPPLVCDELRVLQALGILLDNALRYTPAGGSIRLAVGRERRALEFLVADTGPGVPDGDKERIFHRFYRGDQARSDKEHYGLGLSIAREIARLHKGSLAVADRAGGGAEFRLSLPIAKA